MMPKRTLTTSLLLAWAMVIAGCQLTLPNVRTPTRPDGYDDAPAGSDTDVAGDAPACVRMGAPAGAEQYEMLNRLNAYREANDLNRLRYSRNLESAAQQYARRLHREDFFDHVAPDGSQPADRAEAAGFCNRYVGENLAYGLNQATSPEQAMEGLKNSPTHNENMLRARWDYVGIGYLAVPGFAGTEYWWVQLFGDVE